MFRTFQNIYQFLNTDVTEIFLPKTKSTNPSPRSSPPPVPSIEAVRQLDPTQLKVNSPESQKAIALRYYEEILNDANLNTIDELMSDDFMFTLPTHPDPYYGPSGFKDLVTMLHGAFPDVHLDVQHLLVDGETVVGHWVGRGTHTGGSLHTVKGDLPPNGRHFVIDGVSWLKIVDGKIKESLANEDTLRLLLNLGVIPSQIPDTATVVDRYFDEVLNQGSLTAIDEIIAWDATIWHPFLPEPIHGKAGFKELTQLLKLAFPDGKYIVDHSANDGDTAARRWVFSGTHEGVFLGHPASGNTVQFQGVHIFKLSGGRIKEIWVNENALALLDQIG
jgi:steroid delta-isomerase-like uncharacterized protein